MIQSRKILQMAQKPTAKHTLVSDPQLGQLLQAYEGGLRAMQEHKYDKAKPLLQKVVAGANRELADRALRLRGEPVTTVVPAGTRRLWETGTFARTFATLGGSLIITGS